MGQRSWNEIIVNVLNFDFFFLLNALHFLFQKHKILMKIDDYRTNSTTVVVTVMAYSFKDHFSYRRFRIFQALNEDESALLFVLVLWRFCRWYRSQFCHEILFQPFRIHDENFNSSKVSFQTKEGMEKF